MNGWQLMKKCPAPLIIRAKIIKTKMSHQSILVRRGVVKNTSPGEDTEKGETIPSIGGDVIQHIYYGNSMKVLQDLKIEPSYNPQSPHLDA